MKIRHLSWAALCAASLGLAGCTPEEPKVVEAPPFTPPAEQKEPEGKPKGYGSDDRYQKAMEKQFGGGNR